MKSLNLLSESLLQKITGEKSLPETKFFINEMKTIGIEKLPYGYASLRRFIDPETMKFHYQKHYKGYVNKLNSALRKKEYGDVELEKIVKQISKYNTTIRNNAGGAFNHALFWKMLSPTPQKPNSEILDKIKKDFGSYREFKERFESVAKKRFGSGWVWLVMTKSGRLKVMSTQNQDNPLMNIFDKGGFPVLGLDLWEHAYYLKYQNKRDEYIQNFWEAINWKFVNELYLSKTKKEETLNESFMINEQKESYRPIGKEIQNYMFILSNNKNLLWTFRKCIDSVLSDVYGENYYEKGEYAPGEMSGVYDIDGVKGRSVLNKLNTNIIGFVILLHDINKAVKKMGEPEITLIGKNPKEQINEVYRFCDYIKKFKNRIFPSSNTLTNIMNVISKTHSKGESNESFVNTLLKKKLGDENVKNVGKLGSEQDMSGGVDIILTIDGVDKTGQVKPIYSITQSEGEYVIKIKGFVKDYKTDLLIFTDNKKVYVFDNKNVDASGDHFKIPVDNLIYELV
jgi:Fe-Mn family superoxide dismutase